MLRLNKLVLKTSRQTMGNLAVAVGNAVYLPTQKGT